jgi:hypothetical protein
MSDKIADKLLKKLKAQQEAEAELIKALINAVKVMSDRHVLDVAWHVVGGKRENLTIPHTAMQVVLMVIKEQDEQSRVVGG